MDQDDQVDYLVWFSPQSVNITGIPPQHTQSFPLRSIGFLCDSYSPFSIDIAGKTYGHPVNPCKHLQCTLFLFIFRKVSIVKKQTSQTVEKEFQAGRDLIEDEFAEENRVKVEVYAYYAKSIGKNIL